MANVIRTTKRIINPISGRVIEVTIEIDKAVDAQMTRFQTASKIQRELGFSLDSRHTSTLGAGKHTGNMGKAMKARNFSNPCSNKAWKERRRQRDAKSLKRQDARMAA